MLSVAHRVKIVQMSILLHAAPRICFAAERLTLEVVSPVGTNKVNARDCQSSWCWQFWITVHHKYPSFALLLASVYCDGQAKPCLRQIIFLFTIWVYSQIHIAFGTMNQRTNTCVIIRVPYYANFIKLHNFINTKFEKIISTKEQYRKVLRAVLQWGIFY